jgi:hypothetical protein
MAHTADPPIRERQRSRYTTMKPHRSQSPKGRGPATKTPLATHPPPWRRRLKTLLNLRCTPP